MNLVYTIEDERIHAFDWNRDAALDIYVFDSCTIDLQLIPDVWISPMIEVPSFQKAIMHSRMTRKLYDSKFISHA